MDEIRSTGGATNETSYYSALETLLNAIGQELRLRVIANGQLRNQGAGHPDFGLYTQNQCRSGKPMVGQSELPERGVVEVKGLAEAVLSTAKTAQISKYWQHYRLVIVTNYREFLLIGADPAGGGNPMRLEGFSLVSTDTAFWQSCKSPRTLSKAKGSSFVEYLRRALAHLAPLTRPADLAWLLASYARDALVRVEAQATLPALANIRSGLEQALGLQFKAEKGEHFFRSTLVQTLFYGIFAAWVQWCREHPLGSMDRFDWHAAGWSLHVPMIRNLFDQVATPTRLGPLGLTDILDWTGAALARVDRIEFFHAFEDRLAVQYFYEPFLSAFDPLLRKELGVWYTPPEVVHYMVNRVDTVLRSELGIPDGFADPRVIVLEPCCGTGSFVVEILDLIAKRLKANGGDALAAEDLKHAAMTRIFGFEIMPAAFVIAHWQVGLLLASAGAPLNDMNERAAIYLTNSLTGWQPPAGPTPHLMFPELEAERDAAEAVKHEAPILVVLGNPPYNAFAGTSPVEEAGLVDPYKFGLRRDWGITHYNLDELYVRFMRVAERRIVEGVGRGIVCFISSYSYLSDASFVVMRSHLLRGFDTIRIDSLNGDSRETGKRTPNGDPDPSVFSTSQNPAGIRLGTAVGLMVRTGTANTGHATVRYRQFWGSRKRQELVESLDDPEIEASYETTIPTARNRFNFRPQAPAASYDEWPSLKDLAEIAPFSGLQEHRMGAIISVDKASLENRMRRYLDPSVTYRTLLEEDVGPVHPAGGYAKPEAARARILMQEPYNPQRIVRYALLPLDNRWAYHTLIRPMWNRSRSDYAAQVRPDNLFIISRMMAERPHEGIPVICTQALADYHFLRPNIQAIPVRLSAEDAAQGDMLAEAPVSRANLSARARAWLGGLGAADPDENAETGISPWLHALAISCSPAWLSENKMAVLANWPRIPLPTTASTLASSAAYGRRLADILNPDKPVMGITTGTMATPVGLFGAITRAGGGALSAADLRITAGWGRGGRGVPVMPGKGRITERQTYSPAELAELKAYSINKQQTLDDILARLGPPIDIWLNDLAYWKNVPLAVWNIIIGGYQVFKKWLSYREEQVIGRALTIAEVREGSAIIRRLTALVLLQQELDENYRLHRDLAFAWSAVL